MVVKNNNNKDCDYNLANNFNELAGGNKKKCKNIDQLEANIEELTPKGGIMRQDYVTTNSYNVDVLNKPRIDNSKLLVPLHVDRSKYETHEELYKAITEWWINIKDRSSKTIQIRIINTSFFSYFFSHMSN